MRTKFAIALSATTALISGCGQADPYGAASHRPAPRPHAPEETRAAAPPIKLTRSLGAHTPAAAARGFALASTNWSWRTIGANERARAGLASSSLRARLERDLASARLDTTLRRDRSLNRGVVLAVAVQGKSETRTAYVVVRETSASAGLEAIGGTAVRVYRVSVVRISGRWLVDSWSPVS
jgi:hypothetical protein